MRPGRRPITAARLLAAPSSYPPRPPGSSRQRDPASRPPWPEVALLCVSRTGALGRHQRPGFVVLSGHLRLVPSFPSWVLEPILAETADPAPDGVKQRPHAYFNSASADGSPQKCSPIARLGRLLDANRASAGVRSPGAGMPEGREKVLETWSVKSQGFIVDENPDQPDPGRGDREPGQQKPARTAAPRWASGRQTSTGAAS